MTGFILDLIRPDGRILPAHYFTDTGVVFHNEFSAWPRNISISIEPATEATKEILRRSTALDPYTGMFHLNTLIEPGTGALQFF